MRTIAYFIASIFIFTAFLLVLVVGPDTRVLLQGKILYWSMPILFALGLFFLQKIQLIGFLKKYGVGVISAAALAGIVAVFVPSEMRVQWDETCLVTTSQAMHFFRSNLQAAEAIPDRDTIFVSKWRMDKRPPLFPFLISVVHDIRGVAVSNAFLLNTILLFLLLTLAYVFVSVHLGSVPAFASQLLLLSAPNLLWSASSAGFEVCSTLFFFGMVVAAISFAKKVDRRSLLLFLWLGVCFSYVRYENVAIFLALLGATLWFVRKNIDKTQILPWLLLLPPAFGPLALLLIYDFQPAFYATEARGVVMVSWRYFIEYTPIFLREFFSPIPGRPFPGVLNVFLFLLWPFRRAFDFKIIGVAVLASMLILLFFFGGDASLPTAIRLFLPITIIGALSPLLSLLHIRSLMAQRLLLLGSAVFLVLQLSSIRQERPSKLPEVVAIDALFTLLPKLEGLKQKLLFVSDASPFFVMNGFASVGAMEFYRNRALYERLQQAGQISVILLFDFDLAFAALEKDALTIKSVIERSEFVPFASSATDKARVLRFVRFKDNKS